MTKKLFAVLLLIPMLVFIGDQVMGNSGPEGGKDRKKKRNKTEAKADQAPEPILEVVVQETPVLLNESQETEVDQPQTYSSEAAVALSSSSMKPGLKHSDAEKMAILKDYFTNLDQQHMDYDASDLSSNDEKLGETAQKFLKKNLMDPVRRIDPSDVDSNEWFSRCPSGYFYTVHGDDSGKPLATGTLGQKKGCGRYSLGEYRYDVADGTVEMKLPMDLGYVSVKEYFKMREAIQG